jgi:HAD superfamily hydrolase (TIGR01549 family)
MRRIETIVFDVSGVLIDDLYTVWKADSDAFEACGFGKVESIERFKETFRFPISEYCKAMGVPDNIIPKMEKEFRQVYPKYSGFIKIFPEVKSVLKKLKQEKTVLAVASNIPSSFLMEHLQRFGIDDYFDAVTGQDGCEEKKPSPKPILVTLEKLGSKTEKAAYVGDMEEDVIAGKRAGVYTFAIGRDSSYHPTWRLKKQNPDFLISDLNELLTIVKTLRKSSQDGRD